jgi:hypothetical protein
MGQAAFLFPVDNENIGLLTTRESLAAREAQGSTFTTS